MDPDDTIAAAREFDFAGEIISVLKVRTGGIGPGRVLIVKAPGEPPRVGREAVEFLRPLIPHLSAKRDKAGRAVIMIAGGSPKEVLDGERIALALIEKERG